MVTAQTWHLVHVVSLGTIILFSLLGWTISAGFIDHNYAIERTAEGLEVAANLLTFLFGIAFLCFCLLNLGAPGTAIKSVWIELTILFILWVLLVAAAGALSRDLQYAICGSIYAPCDLGRASAAFTWLTFLLVTFLIGWLFSWAMSARKSPMQSHTIWNENTRDHA